MKARTKIYTACIALALIAFSGLFAIVTLSHKADRQRAMDLVETYTESAAKGIYTFFADAITIATSTSQLTCVQDFDWDTAGRDFTSIVRANRFIYRISLIDSDGYIRDAYAAGPVGNPTQDGMRTENNDVAGSAKISAMGQQYFRFLVTENTHGERRFNVSPPTPSLGSGERVFISSAAIINDGESVGVVNVVQNPLDLFNLYTDITVDFLDKFGKGAHMYLAASDGQTEQLVSDIEYSAPSGIYIDSLFASTNETYDSSIDEELGAALLKVMESDDPVISTWIKGEEYFISGLGLPDTPFGVFITVPVNRFIASQVTGIATDFLVLLVAATIALLIFIRQTVPDDLETQRHKRQSRKNRQHGSWGLDETLAPPELPPEE